MMMHGPMGRFAGLDRERGASLRTLDVRTVARLWGYVRPHAAGVTVSVLLMVAASASALAGPYLAKTGIDVYVAGGDGAGLARVGVLMIVAALAGWVASYHQGYIVSRIGHAVIRKIRDDLFSHLMSLDMAFHDRAEVGRLMSRVSGDVDSISHVITQGVTAMVADSLTVIGIAVIMAYMNLRLALVTLTVVPMLVLAIVVFQKKMSSAFDAVRRRAADVSANIQETISGVRVAHAFAREDANIQRFDETNVEAMRAGLRAATIFYVFFPTIELISAIGTAAVVGAGGAASIRGEVSVGTLVAFLSYVTRFFMPLRELGQVYNMLVSAGVSARRIFELLDERPAVVDADDAVELPHPVRGHVRFENVWFEYEPGRPVLQDFTLEARPGETIAIVGATGAGKTTVINLLTRFYDPTSGRVSVDGIDLRSLKQASLRRAMGVVLQEGFLFAGTVADNIRFGRPGATDEEVRRAAEIVGLDDFIMSLPNGYGTNVHERGVRFSPGQRQLLAIARAMVADPRIIVLDEATSSVDPITETLLQKAIAASFKGRTAVIVAHRLNTVRNADRIYVMDAGRVVESGTHRELLEKRGVYHALWQRQVEGAPLEQG